MYNQYCSYESLRVWRNGRRARLRGVFERVWVQVPPLAPSKTEHIARFFLFKQLTKKQNFNRII